jgi:hypothetical protein
MEAGTGQRDYLDGSERTHRALIPVPPSPDAREKGVRASGAALWHPAGWYAKSEGLLAEALSGQEAGCTTLVV